jgi:hypothetical protein
VAANVTLAEIRMLVGLYADERPEDINGHFSPEELNDLINLELKSLYDRLVAARGHDYYESESTFSTASGTATYALSSMTPSAADLYEVRRVQLEWGSKDHEPVSDYKKAEETWYNNVATWGPWSSKAWRLVGSSIKFVPTPTSVVTCRLLFIPALAELKGNGATFDGVNGWHDAVSISVAIKVLKAQKMDTGKLEEERDIVLRRIDDMAADRAANERHRVIDVEPERDFYRHRGRLHGLPRP